MSNRALVITVIIIVLVAVGIVAASRINTTSNNQVTSPTNNNTNNSNNASANANTNTAPAAANTAASSCQRDFDASKLQTAKVTTANQFVILDIKDFGQIKVQLYDKDAPKTVENFLRLTNAGYYDCLTFHRVAKGFVIQGGDPTGTGSGGDSAFGGPFSDELNANTPSYKTGYVKGVLAMANSGPNTNTSQFFIMLGDNTTLPHNYTIFGKVAAGQDVVDKIGQVDITPGLGPTDGAPVSKVIITKAAISAK